jgi:hypothetical protein
LTSPSLGSSAILSFALFLNQICVIWAMSWLIPMNEPEQSWDEGAHNAVLAHCKKYHETHLWRMHDATLVKLKIRNSIYKDNGKIISHQTTLLKGQEKEWRLWLKTQWLDLVLVWD